LPAGKLQHTGEVLSLAFSPNGASIASGAGDKLVRVWESPGTAD
jgi:WD40 repeat protein